MAKAPAATGDAATYLVFVHGGDFVCGAARYTCSTRNPTLATQRNEASGKAVLLATCLRLPDPMFVFLSSLKSSTCFHGTSLVDDRW